MSETVYVNFSIPAKAEKVSAVKQLLIELDSYDLDDITYSKEDTPLVTTFQFCDGSTHMSGWEQTIQALVQAKIPFDMQTEAYTGSPETHYIFRKGMKTPFKYYGEEPSVSVETLRDMLKQKQDFTRKDLIEYLDKYFPKLPPIETAAKDWELKQKNVRSGQGR